EAPAVRKVREEPVGRVVRRPFGLGWAGAVQLGVVARAPLGTREDVVRVPELAPESVLPPALERDPAVCGFDLLRRRLRADAEGRVVVGHSRLLRLLCS